MKNKSSDKSGPRKPCALLYRLAAFLTGLFYRVFYRLDTQADDDVRALCRERASVLVLCNHESNYDFLMVANALRPLKINFMVTTYFFHHNLLAKTLRLMGCIPKRQFVPDARAIKDVLHVVKRGGSVCIFPEGQVCYSGATSDVDMSVAKLVKKLGIPVIAASVRGNYLAMPKWAHGGKFPAKSECRARLLLTAGQAASLDIGELGPIVYDALRYDDYEWQRSVMAKSRRPRTAEGLQNMLWRCPKCEAEFMMRADGGAVTCEKCGYSARLDEYGFFVQNGELPLVFDTVSKWFGWQRGLLEREIAGGGLPISSPCRLMKTRKGTQGYVACGEGTMTLTDSGLFFSGLDDGAPFEVGALCEHQTTLPFNSGVWGIDVPGERENYALCPEDSRMIMKYLEGYIIARKRLDKNR